MKTKKKKCSCGCNQEGYIWAKGMLKGCYLKQNPSKSLKRGTSLKQQVKNIQKKGRARELHQWFQELWDKEPHYSEISNTWLGNENKTLFWHHILPKSKYPEYEFDRDNLIRLTADEHQMVESNPKIYTEVNKRRELLKIKYNMI